MQLEVLIVLDIVAFLFLALGIIPFKNNDQGTIPLANKVIFIFVSAIIFFSLAMSAVGYDYTYCYINQTTSDFSSNITINNATCSNYVIENMGLSFMNWGFGFLSVTLGIIIIIMALASKNDSLNTDD